MTLDKKYYSQNIFTEDFAKLMQETGLSECKDKMPLITIYYDPKDFPGKYVARLFMINTKVYTTWYVSVADTKEDILKTIPLNMIKLDRQLNDDPKIVEVWM